MKELIVVNVKATVKLSEKRVDKIIELKHSDSADLAISDSDSDSDLDDVPCGLGIRLNPPVKWNKN